MGPSKKSGSGFKYFKIRSKHNDEVEACIKDVDGNNIGDYFSGKLLAVKPDSYEWQGETKHKMVFVLDISEDPSVVAPCSLEVNFNQMYKSIVNRLAKSATDMGSMIQGELIEFNLWTQDSEDKKRKFASATIKIGGQPTELMFSWDQLSKIKKNPDEWVRLYEKYIKPHIPSEWKPNTADEPVMAGVAEAKNGPVDDDSNDLPF